MVMERRRRRRKKRVPGRRRRGAGSKGHFKARHCRKSLQSDSKNKTQSCQTDANSTRKVDKASVQGAFPADGQGGGSAVLHMWGTDRLNSLPNKEDLTRAVRHWKSLSNTRKINQPSKEPASQPCWCN